MALSNDLISQFVKLTNDKPEAPKSTIAYGTVVEADGSKWVRLDGSPDGLLTPIETTTEVSQDDRVIVDIKDHTAVVTGNLTTPAINKDSSIDNGDGSSTKISDLGIIIADKVNAKELKAETARINELFAKDVEIDGKLSANEASINELDVGMLSVKGELTATKGTINNLDTKVLNVEETLTAANAEIETLKGNYAEFETVKADYGEFKKLTVDDLTAKNLVIDNLKTDKLDANWANIDYANMEMARVEDFFAKAGIIESITSDGATITGTLVGVTIKGDTIEGGTIVADKLVIAGEDGLYYQLNASGISTDSKDDDGVTIKQTEYNSLNGRIITAKSITAEQISVSDLIAFDATIGGFNIGSDSIYSGVKDAVDNTTRGIYLDNDGQIAFGDSNNYIKYHRVETFYRAIASLNDDGTIHHFIAYNNTVLDPLQYDIANWPQSSTGKFTTDTNEEVWVVTNPDDETTDPIYFYKRVSYKLRIAAEDIVFTSGSMDKVKSLTEHMKVGTYTDPKTGDTNPSVELFEDDSDSVQVMTNKRNTFKDGEEEKTSIGSDGITTTEEVRHIAGEYLRYINTNQTAPSVEGTLVEEAFTVDGHQVYSVNGVLYCLVNSQYYLVDVEKRQQQFVWATRSNGNFGLMWKDVTR